MIYRFADFHYDSAQRLLFRGAERIPLEPKALDTLHVLLERRGLIVEKAELMRLVWPDTTVEDIGLARNISLLRKALGSDELIETIPRRGYRFVGEPAAVAAPVRRRWVLPAILAATGFVALTFYLFYWPSPYVSQGRGPRMAVVPFDCVCPGADGAALSQALTEALITELSRGGDVRLISPGTVDRYRQVGFPMPMMGRILGLDVLLEGTIRKQDDKVEVAARLVDVRSGRLIWAESYDGDAPAVRISKSLKNITLKDSTR